MRLVGSMWRGLARATLGVTLLACAAPTAVCQNSPERAESAAWPGENWPVSTPEAEGFDADALRALIDDMQVGKYGLLDHFLLIRHGKVIADRHFPRDYAALSAPHEPVDAQYDYDHPNWHPYYQGTELHTLQSVTKSITSAVLGIALDDGHIPGGVSTPAMSFFEDYDFDVEDPLRAAMTVEDLLTMRSGIDWAEWIPYTDPRNSCIRLEASEQWIQFVLDQPMRERPGTRFDYNSGASVLLGKIVAVATGQRIDDYARERLFDPLGIDDFYWKVTPDQEIDTEGGLYLTAHDLARIAYLFLREGRWRDRQIVSESWVRESLAPHVPDIRPNNGHLDSGYGYQWWIPEHENGEPVIYQGSGFGGQFPIVVPEHDLAIVFLAWNIHGGGELSAQRAVRERILPAIRD